MNHTPQLPIYAHVHFVIIFNNFTLVPSYKIWKDQISDIDAGCVNKTYHDLSITGICDEMDVPLWSECRQRNVIRQRILIRHKKEITSALIWKKRAAILNLNMYGDKINAVFASNHHAILSQCYERYLNDTVLTALSAVYHIL